MKTPYKSTYHRDGSITFWSCYLQQWVRSPASHVNNQDLATMDEADRARTMRLREKSTRAIVLEFNS